MRSNKMLKLMDRQSKNIVAFRTRGQMEWLIENGEALRLCSRCGTANPARKNCITPGEKHAWVFKATDSFFKREDRSSAALTAHDARANAGIGSHAEVLKARIRVGWWFLMVTDATNPLPSRIPYGTYCPLPVTRQPLPKPV